MRNNEVKEYCQNCNDFVNYSVRKVKREVKVKDILLNVEIFECYCSKCGEEISILEYEKMNDIIIYDCYKEHMGLLTSAQIKNIRKKRNMTQIELAKFLNIGEKDITRYELGAIQSKSIDRMLRLVDDDSAYQNMRRVFLNENDIVFIKDFYDDVIEKTFSFEYGKSLGFYKSMQNSNSIKNNKMKGGNKKHEQQSISLA